MFSFNNKNNKIILHKENGEVKIVQKLNWLDISFKGNNSIVEIWEPYKFRKVFGKRRSKIKINGNNNYIQIKQNKRYVQTLHIIEIGHNNKIFIGENFYVTGKLKIDFANQSNLELNIGDNCMFGQNIEFMLGDWHSIYNNQTQECINKPKNGISIGNHV